MAIRINKVYTRGGDKGQTSLVGGARVDKTCQKLETYGTVDELICLVGTARTVIALDKGMKKTARKEMEQALRKIQNRLFDVGSILATPAGVTYASMPAITDADVTELEKQMDAMQASLKPLTSFTLPGGTMPNAMLHQCRAVCRRAEREILRLAQLEAVAPQVIKYVNRLSDLFFVMTRFVSHLAGAPEYLWEYGGKKKGDGRPKAPSK